MNEWLEVSLLLSHSIVQSGTDTIAQSVLIQSISIHEGIPNPDRGSGSSSLPAAMQVDIIC